MTRARLKLVAAALIATLAACSSGPTGPVAGILKVTLSTSPTSGADGAILLTLAGPAAPSAVTAQTGFRVFGTAAAATNNLAVTGTLTQGAVLFTISVDDVNKVAQYSALVQQIAASSNFALRTAANYRLSVTK